MWPFYVIFFWHWHKKKCDIFIVLDSAAIRSCNLTKRDRKQKVIKILICYVLCYMLLSLRCWTNGKITLFLLPFQVTFTARFYGHGLPYSTHEFDILVGASSARTELNKHRMKLLSVTIPVQMSTQMKFSGFVCFSEILKMKKKKTTKVYTFYYVMQKFFL